MSTGLRIAPPTLQHPQDAPFAGFGDDDALGRMVGDGFRQLRGKAGPISQERPASRSRRPIRLNAIPRQNGAWRKTGRRSSSCDGAHRSPRHEAQPSAHGRAPGLRRRGSKDLVSTDRRGRGSGCERAPSEVCFPLRLARHPSSQPLSWAAPRNNSANCHASWWTTRWPSKGLRRRWSHSRSLFLSLSPSLSLSLSSLSLSLPPCLYSSSLA